jgi:hypothetical protein
MDFSKCDWLLASRLTRRHVKAAQVCRAFDSLAPACLPSRAARLCRARPRGSILRTPKVFGTVRTPYNFRRAQAARARRWMRRETATQPTAESTPEFWKSGCSGVAHSPVADERHGRSCPRQSLSPRSCARPDSHLCESGDAIVERHSARVPRQILRKRKLQQTRACDLSNARMYSLPCKFVTCSGPPQEISARSTLSNAAVCRV